MTLEERFSELESRFLDLEKELFEYKNPYVLKVGQEIPYDIGKKGYMRGMGVITEINILRRKDSNRLYRSFKIFSKDAGIYYDVEMYEICE